MAHQWNTRFYFIFGFILLNWFSPVAQAITVRYDQSISQNSNVVAEFSVTMKEGLLKTESRMGGMHLVMIKNNEGAFSYRPSQKLAIVVPKSGQPNFTDELSDYQAFLKKNNGVKVGEESFSGYECEIYQFNEPSSQQPAKAWIWKGKDFPIKIEIEAAPNNMLIEFKNIQLDVEIPDSEFELPPDTQIYDTEAAQAPPGASFQ